jgi:hypothetical protein
MFLNPQVRRSRHTGSFPLHWPEELSEMAPLFPFWEICTHNQLQEIPPCTSGDRTSHFSRIQWSSALSLNLRNPKQSTLDPFSLLFRISPYRDFGGRDVKQLVPSIPETRFTETLMCSQALTFQWPFTPSGLRTS